MYITLCIITVLQSWNQLWNQLPLAIRQSDSVDSFKRALKTYLFRESSLF